MTFKLFERRDKTSRRGTPIVFILQPGVHRVQTGEYCKPGSWNQKAQSVRVIGPLKDPLANKINSALKRASIKLQDLIDEGRTVEEIRSLLKPTTEPLAAAPRIPITSLTKYEALEPVGREFYMLIEKMIQSHKSDWSEDYKKRFKSLRTKILEYDTRPTLDKLAEVEWWRGFITDCIEERGNSGNTLSLDIGIIRTILKEHGLNPPKGMKWSYTDPEMTGLTWEKVLKIASIKPEGSHTMNDSHKLWLASAFTGRRYAEVCGIGPHCFRMEGGKLRYRNIGKGNKMIDIPLLPEAVEFFEGGKRTFTPVGNCQVNLDIKQFCLQAGLTDTVHKIRVIGPDNVIRATKFEWQTVHFHTARHSYAQHIVELAAGKPHAEKFVSFMLGHASFATTWKYMNRVASSNEQMFDEIIG